MKKVIPFILATLLLVGCSKEQEVIVQVVPAEQITSTATVDFPDTEETELPIEAVAEDDYIEQLRQNMITEQYFKDVHGAGGMSDEMYQQAVDEGLISSDAGIMTLEEPIYDYVNGYKIVDIFDMNDSVYNNADLIEEFPQITIEDVQEKISNGASLTAYELEIFMMNTFETPTEERYSSLGDYPMVGCMSYLDDRQVIVDVYEDADSALAVYNDLCSKLAATDRAMYAGTFTSGNDGTDQICYGTAQNVVLTVRGWGDGFNQREVNDTYMATLGELRQVVELPQFRAWMDLENTGIDQNYQYYYEH